MKFSIKYKVFLAFLFFSILPLIILSYLGVYSLQEAGNLLINDAIGNLERQEENRLIKEAENYAKSVTEFLKEIEHDLKELSLLRRDEKVFLAFSDKKRKKIWHAVLQNNKVVEKKEYLPLYKEVAFIDDSGQEKILIKNGKIVPTSRLRNVANPSNTTYLNEDYFIKAKQLKPKEIYLSSLKGFAMTKKDQIGNFAKPEDIKGGNHYDGVLRFSMPIYENEKFIGVLTLAVDHLHLQELTIHIDPRYGFSNLYSGYESGNYAFIFDINGWIITHPKYWDLPGVYKDGSEKRFMTKDSSKSAIEDGIEGFNLDYAGFISLEYPKVAEEVRKKKSGIVTVTNVGGIRKVMAYAPILCNLKPYNQLGVFGGFTLGEKLSDFSESARHSQQTLLDMLNRYQKNVGSIFLFIIIIVFTMGALFSKHIISPILSLSKKTEYLGETDFDSWEKIDRNDEIGELAQRFYEMNKKINEQNANIKKTMEELKIAKKQLEEYNVNLKKEIDILKDEKMRQVDRLSSIGSLAAGLAHEIRNPLTGITLFLDDLHDRLSEDVESKNLIVAALKEIDRVEKLINELLYFSASKPTQKIYINLASVIETVVIFVNKICQKKQITVDIELEEGLMIFADKEKIKQAILNVVLNGIQAMEPGGKLSIIGKTAKKNDKNYCLILIKDTGKGINETELEKIFEPFYTSRAEGTGLGLAICRSIILEHNGIIVANNWENGACFEIWLPMV